MNMKELVKNLKDPITEKKNTYLKYSKCIKVVLRRAHFVGERELPI